MVQVGLHFLHVGFVLNVGFTSRRAKHTGTLQKLEKMLLIGELNSLVSLLFCLYATLAASLPAGKCCWGMF